MSWVFWLSLAFVVYTYFGYPAVLWVRSRFFPRPVRRGRYSGSISVVMVVRNEAAVLPAKLDALVKMNITTKVLPQIVVVSDGSTDQTNEILLDYASRENVHAIVKQPSYGKAAGLNAGIREANGEVVIFMDARQEIEPGAVALLLENFADPSVGCASGELMLGTPGSAEHAAGMGLYWKFEKTIREHEAQTKSTIGATGALYAVRRQLLVNVPPGTILDDVFIPMHVIRQGKRVVFDSRAKAWDVPDQGRQREFARKVRTLTGNYQLLQIAPWLISPANPVLFEFVSHKIMRLFIPFVLCAMMLASIIAAGVSYRVAMAMQITCYAVGAWALAFPNQRQKVRVADAAATFISLNAAACVAFANFAVGRSVKWDQQSPEARASAASKYKA